MANAPEDIYTEPADVDVRTLANLGPLTRLAGRWQGTRGVDVNPKADGPETQAYLETIDLQPIDPQTNGPQVLYGLRYHVHIVKPGEVETFHDQVGYWLWEAATNTVTHSLTIPRAQVVLASGTAAPDAKEFELTAAAGADSYGILSSPFINAAFRTLSFRIRVTINDDGTWSYEEDTVMQIPQRAEPFHHIDRNTLRRIAAPAPNPTATSAAGA